MTLLSKSTTCFSCLTGELGNRIISGEAGWEEAFDFCNCGARKKTLLGINYPKCIAGTVFYIHGTK